MKSLYGITRRGVIMAGAALLAYKASPACAYASFRTEAEPVRSLHLHNIHTGESVRTVYWEKGVYCTEALKDISYVLRDHRSNDMKAIDPHLIDVIAALHKKLDSRKPFEIISGYRSPRSNEYLYEHTSGVNPHSLHMEGRAVDLRLGDRKLSAIRNTAIAMRQGGVGYYPSSRFVHIDTGAVKHW